MPPAPQPTMDAPKMLAIIQARLGSTRLPGKICLDLAGRPMLAHVIERAGRSRLISDLIVATTIRADDLPIVRLCADMNVRVYCGHESDPLERYYQAARLYGADHVLRLKGDCPLIDPQVIDQAIRLHLTLGADYTGNTLQRTYPVGQDVEILSRTTLERVWREAGLRSEREHITLYIPKHADAFRIAHLTQSENMSAKRWTVDYPEDYQLLQRIFDALYADDPLFGMPAVLDFLAEHPELERLNAHIRDDAGIRISIDNDRPEGPPR
jgi:spore coat polysaccharide biosynthesis protein SpsF